MRARYGNNLVMDHTMEKRSSSSQDGFRGPHRVSAQDAGLPGRVAVPAAAHRVDEHLTSLRSPDSYEADQYRVLRHLLEQATAGQAIRVLAVSSPAAGDGKTTTAINLAATLAQSPGARVLLVDADLRRPSVAASLGLEAAGPGLAGAIVDARLDVGEVVCPTAFGFSVLPAGSLTGNPYSLLESPRMARLLEELRAAYDFVVVDTPPLLLVPDCRLIAQWVDGFVIVVAADRTPRRLLAQALDMMDPAKLAGIVFNGDDRPLCGYYTGYYGRYYTDHARESGPRWLSWWRRRRAAKDRKPWR
jgi:capsular exopolysaccharide synthesis family protein